MQGNVKQLGTGCMRPVARYLDHWMSFRCYSTCCSDWFGLCTSSSELLIHVDDLRHLISLYSVLSKQCKTMWGIKHKRADHRIHNHSQKILHKNTVQQWRRCGDRLNLEDVQ